MEENKNAEENELFGNDPQQERKSGGSGNGSYGAAFSGAGKKGGKKKRGKSPGINLDALKNMDFDMLMKKMKSIFAGSKKPAAPDGEEEGAKAAGGGKGGKKGLIAVSVAASAILAGGGFFAYQGGYLDSLIGGTGNSAVEQERAASGGMSGFVPSEKDIKRTQTRKTAPVGGSRDKGTQKIVITGDSKVSKPIKITSGSGKKHKNATEAPSAAQELKIKQPDNRVARTQKASVKPNSVPKYRNERTVRRDTVTIPDRPVVPKDDKYIKLISKSLTDDRLSGSNDILAGVDKEVLQTRSYNSLLEEKLKNMDKLLSYYKKKKELESLISYYRDGVTPDDRKKKELESIVERKLARINAEISKLRRDMAKIDAAEEGARKGLAAREFRNISSDFSGMNIFVKNGEYIAVVTTKDGDVIFRRGDTYNGFVIDNITADSISFSKGNAKFIYNGRNAAGSGYRVVKIELSGKSGSRDSEGVITPDKTSKGYSGARKYPGDDKSSGRKKVPISEYLKRLRGGNG